MDVASQLGKLKALHDSGDLSDDEFREAKRLCFKTLAEEEPKSKSPVSPRATISGGYSMTAALPQKVAILTAGGQAPCLASSIGALIERYTELYPSVDILCYRNGWAGVLLGDSFLVTPQVRKQAATLHTHGGSPVGSSRVKLSNQADCEKRGYVRPGVSAKEWAAGQLMRDRIEVLHTIGGTDTAAAANELAEYLLTQGHHLTVVALPKTINQDCYPVRQTLGAWTAAQEGAKFFSNVVYEHSCNPRMMIVHEVMGRDCGYLTAATALHYRQLIKSKGYVPGLGLCMEKLDIHAIYLPEESIDIPKEADRLRKVMDNTGCVNIFISEGAGVEDIVRELEAKGQELPRDAGGHVKLDLVNPGSYFGKQFAEMIRAEKVMVQKSGYFARAAAPNASDLSLIKSCADFAVQCAIDKKSGCVGHDDNTDGKCNHTSFGNLCCIDLKRIKSGKKFNVREQWYQDMKNEITSERRSIADLVSTDSTAACPAGYQPNLPQGMSLPKKVAILSAGGLAPCLSSAIGGLIERYHELYPTIQIICYIGGYKGLLSGDYVAVTPAVRKAAGLLQLHGGSPIGNSRVKMTNIKDCVKRGLTKEGQDPQKVAAEQLVKDGVDVLHTVGGDDTNTAAADLADYLKKNNYDLTVIGLPKTIDNDVYPLRQTLGAYTAAEEGAKYFANVVNENSSNPRILIVHEVMGRGCGYLTAATARVYRDTLIKNMVPGLGLNKKRMDVHAVFIPEIPVNIHAEAARLKEVMNDNDCVNIFISEGAGVHDIVKEKEARGEEIPRDAFGHVKLDAVQPGEWFGKQFAAMIGAEKVLVQKSGYFSRSAPANAEDQHLIKSCTTLAVECALRRQPGVIGHDEDQGNVLRAVEFPRIKGGKPFDVEQPWFVDMLNQIGQKTHYDGNVRVAYGDVESVAVRMNMASAHVQSAALFQG